MLKRNTLTYCTLLDDYISVTDDWKSRIHSQSNLVQIFVLKSKSK